MTKQKLQSEEAEGTSNGAPWNYWIMSFVSQRWNMESFIVFDGEVTISIPL